ncbi:uncharacterized protein LOC126739257 [Anthonomus grandis grandis]|uniref:uncharacterized protein LOC126739257 n=1 Tax=Anthonomus grandis grandis TaxID=2921223 RepID=UPI002165EB80|nr:uncharacterized protein LOC126739257 [Anthonomus grandis grandis]
MNKIVALIAVCFVAIQAANVVNVVRDGKLEGAADDVKELYYKLLEKLGEAITGANNTMNEALDAAKAYAVEVETAAKAEIQSTLDSFQAQLDELNQKAKDAGIDITECRKYETQFTQLPDTLMDEIVACVNQQISKAQSEINSAMNTAMAIQQDYYNIEKEIDDCGSGWKAVTCLAELSVKIADDTIEGPSKISDNVNNTVTIIQNAWPEIKQCATNAVEKAPSQAAQIVKDFAVCCAIP